MGYVSNRVIVPFGWMDPRNAVMSLKGRAFGLIVAIAWLGFGPIAAGQGPPRPGSAVETWEVDTRACEQVMGSSPWPCLAVNRHDEASGALVRSDPSALLASMAGRPAVFLIHGNGYDDTQSIMEALLVRDQLASLGGLPEGTMFVILDWPSERSLRSLVRDLNEKARRSRIAAYHLARFLEAAPANSMICLMGQSDGARIALTTMHLLSGDELKPFLTEPGVRLDSGRPDLRLRGVSLEAAAGHHWLDPGERLEGALPNCEALLNLWNKGDLALSFYVYGSYTGLKRPLGLVGLSRRDRRKLGPLVDRVEEIDHDSLSGRRHTLFTRALTYPFVGPRIAAYTSFADVSEGLGKRFKTR
jgi:hypothetical protein